jgi:CHASE2 domain-containing sensor protein
LTPKSLRAVWDITAGRTGSDGVRTDLESMTLALRVKAGGLLLLALAGLSMGAAAAAGVIPVTPPAVLAPALAVAVVALAAVKVAAVGGGILAYARPRA